MLAHSPLVVREGWAVELVVNPHAGAFRRPDIRHHLRLHFEAFLRRIGRTEERGDRVRIWLTTGKNAERDLVERILLSREAGARTLVVIAGGDGTANHILSAVLDQEPRRWEDLHFLRLPLGTGNDYADAPDLASMFRLLAGEYRLSRPPYLRYSAAGRPHGYGFNIGSIGLDAWVVMTNAYLRKILPGNFYRIAADLAGFFYKTSVRPCPLEAEYYLEGKLVGRSSGPFMLTAFAPEGKRTYGGGIRVLPGEENLCRVRPVSLWTFLRLKGNFFQGLHVHEPYTTMVRCDRMVFFANCSLPAQHDGEVFWLRPEDCPYEVHVLPGELTFLRSPRVR